ncbi:MAG TPA: ATP-binding protein, partial [Syntrophomonadaceae bacterium]|nr:ATP-binding protein [Syntrophomonadaceae bacterium]
MTRTNPIEVLQVIESDRWIQFVSSVSAGLQLGIYLFDPVNQFEIQVPQYCPQCQAPYNNYSLFERNRVSQEVTSRQPVLLGLYQDSMVAALQLSDNLFAIVSDCPCSKKVTGTNLLDRARVVGDILSTFLTTLQESFQDGRRAIELSTLRQMNHIILSLFQGDESAVKKALDLILSAVIVLLDAEGAWLRIHSSPEVLISKGDQSYIGLDSHAEVEVQSLNYAAASGQLGVASPANHRQARDLLQLMAQECSIILEVEHLFKLVEKRFSQVLEAIHSAVLIIDSHNTITYANRAAQDFLCEPGINPVGQQVQEIPGPWVAPLLTDAATPILGYMEPFSLRQKGCRWLDWQLCALRDEGKNMGWLVLFEDRSDYHRWQEASRKADRFATTATLVGKLAHEMRNPLSASSGLLQILSVKRDPAKVRGYADLIRREMDRMTRLLDDFLLLGTPAQIEPNPVDLVALLDELHYVFRGEASGTDVEIVIQAQPCSPLWGDPGQLSKAIVNLVKNAITATTSPNPVCITLEEEIDYIVLSVRDYGAGFSPAVEDKLFEPFFTTKERGTGLGLPVVQAIVHNHGGRISAANAQDGGAIFRIEFPKWHPDINGKMNVDVLVLLGDNPISAVEETLRLSGFSTVAISDRGQLSFLAANCQPGVILIDTSWYQVFNEGNLKAQWPHAPLL